MSSVLRLLKRSFRPLLTWCLLVAVPVYGVSGTLVELLGANHVHRQAALSVTVAKADPMEGWVDMRRASSSSHGAQHDHSHSVFERHHHDQTDESVVALDGGPLQASTSSDDGGSSAGSSVHLAALNEAGVPSSSSQLRFFWPAAAPAAAPRWTADGPTRPPKS